MKIQLTVQQQQALLVMIARAQMVGEEAEFVVALKKAIAEPVEPDPVPLNIQNQPNK